MEQSIGNSILALAEQEEADAVRRAFDADPLVWRSEPPLPLPPFPPMAD